MAQRKLTLAQAKKLTHGTVLFHRTARNADGSPCRWRVSGVPITWKRSPGRVKVPVKHGLYCSDYVTEKELDQVSLFES